MGPTKAPTKAAAVTATVASAALVGPTGVSLRAAGVASVGSIGWIKGKEVRPLPC